LIDFINGDYEQSILLWEKVLKKDPTIKNELQPWIEKAREKLKTSKP